MIDTHPDLPTRDALANIARQLTNQLPDLHQMAVEAASTLLATWGVTAHPDTFYWHRFDNAQSSALSFSGFVHMGPPVESLTFTELLMRRYRASDLDNADLLHVMGGFYSADAQAGRYAEHNEVRLEPEAVLTALWKVDFAARYTQRLAQFWQTQTDAVYTLIRVNALSAAMDAHQNKQITRQQMQWVFDGMGVQQPMAPTVSAFSGNHPPAQGVAVCALRLAGYDFVSLLCFTVPDGRRLLYLAGRQVAIEAFIDERALQYWLYAQVQAPSTRAQLLHHGALLEAAPRAARIGSFELLAKKPVEAFSRQITWRAIEGDAAHWLGEQTRLQMTAEARLALRSNSELRKQLWLGYLGAGLQTFGVVAMVSWPVALLVVVASAAKFSLHVDRAVNAADGGERKAALYAAIFSGIELVLNMTLLLPHAAALTADLDALQARPVLPLQRPVLADIRGVLQVDGRTMLRLQGRLYQARYDQALQCWLIVDPERPFAFGGTFPVRFNEQLEWELLPTACLRGGGGCMGVARIPEPPVSYAEFEVPIDQYEVPGTAREATRELLSHQFRRMLSGEYYNPQSPLNPVLDSLDRLRVRISEDAQVFISQWRSAGRSPLSAPDPAMAPYTAVRRVLDRSGGLVIGESHQSIASKRFLIDNMQALAHDGVDTLYMEHLLTDLHQAELNAAPRSGRLPDTLQDYLRDMDVGHRTDPSGRYTFTQLVQAAHREGIQVRALDCAASYRLEGIEDRYQVGGTLRQQVFSYYASRVINAHRALPSQGKWIALVGDTHASTYKRIPGLAQLHNTTALRIVDAGAGQQTNITLDPGEYYLPSISRPDGIVRADWRLALQVREAPFEYRDPATAPPGVLRP